MKFIDSSYMTNIGACFSKELDFIHEGKNAERAAADLKKFSYVHIPEVDWDLTSKVSIL